MTFPTVTIQAVDNIAPTTVKANATIVNCGANFVKRRGFVYGLVSQADPGNTLPSLSGYTKYIEIAESFPTGAFYNFLSALSKDTLYYIRAYAKNIDGYAYSAEISFTTLLNVYPDSIYVPRALANRTKIEYVPSNNMTLFAEDVIKLNDEVVSIENELGENPRGLFASVAAFLSDLASKCISVFTDISDVPNSYEGEAGKVLKVNANEDGLEFGAGGGGGAFTDLSDVPASYDGEAGKVLKVNVGQNGLEFGVADPFPGYTIDSYVKKLLFVKESQSALGGVACSVISGDYIYVSVISINKIYKYDLATLTKQSESANYGGIINTLCISGNYIYAAGNTIRKVFKYDTATLTKQAETVDYGGNITTICTDDTYIYANGSTTRKIYKFDIATMTKQAESLTYGGDVASMFYYNNNLYVGGSTIFKVFKYDTATLTKQAETASTLGNIMAMTFDDTYFYVSSLSINKIYKYDFATLTKQAVELYTPVVMMALCISGDYIYVGGGSTNKLFKYDKATFLKCCESDYYANPLSTIQISGDYIYVGGGTATIFKYIEGYSPILLAN